MAYVRSNLFYEREQWKKPLLISAIFHAALVVGGFALGWVLQPHSSANDWGNNGGDAVEAKLVSAAIPIPKPDQSTNNIVATENKGVAQTVPQPKPVETEDGIEIKGKVTPKPKIEKPVPPTHAVAHPVPTPVDTAVPYGEGGPVTGPYGNFTAPNTKGGFSVKDAAFGSKYGWYIDNVRRAVQSQWLTYEIDPRINAPHRAFIEFDITRDGKPTNVRLSQSSGVPSLDQSAMRAVQRIDGFGALPEGNKLEVEFWFDYPPK